MKRLYVIILILSFCIIFYNNSGFSAEEDVKTKIEARLQELKRQVLQEQAMLRALNEKLIQENEELRTRHRLPKETPLPAKEKIVYKEKVVYQTIPEQQKQIQELEQQAQELNKALRIKEQDMAQKDRELEKFYKTIPAQQKRIQELEKELSSAQGHQANRGLSTKNTQLKQALQEAQQENTKLSQEAEALRGELNVKPSENIVYRADPEQQERIQELEKNLEDLNNALQAKAQEINQKEEENSSLRQDIYNTYQQLDNMLTETLR